MGETVVLREIETTRQQTLADKEVQLITMSTGLLFENVPKKIVNPNLNDWATAHRHLGITNLLRVMVISQVAEGFADIPGNTILIEEQNFVPERLFGIDWSAAVGGVSWQSLHEAGHIWLGQNMKVSPSVGKVGLADDVVSGVVSEGVAIYLANRAIEFVRDAMVSSAKEIEGLSEENVGRIDTIYSSLKYVEGLGGGMIKEDVGNIEFEQKARENNLIQRLKNMKRHTNIMQKSVYRLGNVLVTTRVNDLISEGMSESEALLFLAQNPPRTLEEVKGILRL